MINIVFLDSYTLNPGDLSWEQFSRLGNFKSYERTDPEDVIERAKDADVLIINKVRFCEEQFSQLPRLRLICVAAAGYDVIDVKAARAYGVSVCNAAGYANKAVAQMTLALLLEATNRVGYYAEANRKGFWSRSEDFCCWTRPLCELDGKRVAIVGMGNIGKSVSEILQTLGCKILAVTSKSQEELPENIEKITLEEAFRTCRVVSFHCPLTEKTKGIVNANLLKLANKELIIINTARGKIVNDEDLASALREKKIAAYCCDVLSQEPPSPGHPLLSAPNAYITPHIAWATVEARQRIIDITEANITAFLSGKAQNVVNN